MQKMDRLLKLEFDINYINVVSKKDLNKHAVIRLIISSLATPQEIKNFTKNDIRGGKNNFTIILSSGNKTRISPIDEKTYGILKEITSKNKNEKIFKSIDVDSVVEKYSPKKTVYNASKLRKAVIEILEDCLLFGEENYVKSLILGKNIGHVRNFLLDFHPMYSGMWDIDDDEAAREFIRSYISFTGITDVKTIASEIGESVERVTTLLK